MHEPKDRGAFGQSEEPDTLLPEAGSPRAAEKQGSHGTCVPHRRFQCTVTTYVEGELQPAAFCVEALHTQRIFVSDVAKVFAGYRRGGCNTAKGGLCDYRDKEWMG